MLSCWSAVIRTAASSHTTRWLYLGATNYRVLNGEGHDEPGERWHFPVLPTTLARLLQCSQARHKEQRSPPNVGRGQESASALHTVPQTASPHPINPCPYAMEIW